MRERRLPRHCFSSGLPAAAPSASPCRPPLTRCLQKMLRGRAAQLRMFTGKERRCVLWRPARRQASPLTLPPDFSSSRRCERWRSCRLSKSFSRRVPPPHAAGSRWLRCCTADTDLSYFAGANAAGGGGASAAAVARRNGARCGGGGRAHAGLFVERARAVRCCCLCARPRAMSRRGAVRRPTVCLQVQGGAAHCRHGHACRAAAPHA